MDKKIEKFAGELKQALGTNLVSFVVYGSTAAGDAYKTSDINTLVVINDASVTALRAMSKAVRGWVSHGNAAPLIFTKKRLAQSTDVFPMEMMDIKENRIVAAGVDIFKSIKISRANLRLELEREFKGALIKLRTAYVLSSGDNNRVKDLMRNSITTFAVLCKAALRLYGKKAPALKKDIIAEGSKTLKLNPQVFFDILNLKEKRDVIKERANSVFEEYLCQIEKAKDAVDAFKRRK